MSGYADVLIGNLTSEVNAILTLHVVRDPCGRVHSASAHVPQAARTGSPRAATRRAVRIKWAKPVWRCVIPV